MTQHSRDPRVDPRPGDRLGVTGLEYELFYVGHGTVAVRRYPNGRNPMAFSQATWPGPFVFAEVLHVA